MKLGLLFGVTDRPDPVETDVLGPVDLEVLVTTVDDDQVVHRTLLQGHD
jgi:hypothetical protein